MARSSSSSPVRTNAGLQARALGALAVAGIAGSSAVFACSSSTTNDLPGGSSDGSANGLDGGGADGSGNSTDATATSAEGLFRALQPQLLTTCGGTGGVCHVSGSYRSAPKWLGAPDPYTSAKAYPGIIPDDNDPDDSKLLTQVAHEGPSLSDTPTLYADVKQWVTAEISGRPLLATTEFALVSGANSVDLTALAGGLGGVKLTFTASPSSTGDTVTLLDMQISAPAPKGLHIVDPYFVIYPNGPVIDDPTNGFVGEGPLDVPAGTTAPFYEGTLILRPYAAGDKVKIVFSTFGLSELPDGGNTIPACKSLATFQSSAVPAFGQMYDSLDSGTLSCLGCHAGGNNIAINAMDLTMITSDPATACAQALLKLLPDNLEQSPLILTPMGIDGGDEYHPVRSAGQDYHDAIIAWGMNERTP